ncbi:MAG: FKBP-type peptidyl-prolyl cis-trans isomerase [Calditrichaeota bacterium]|nr:FKBP-type peptidyl-prolyl cis-trans isomerase [Calditrichota bacterium]
MRRTIIIACGLVFAGCQGNAQEKVKLDTQADKVSYSIGIDIGRSFKMQGIEINTAAFLQGLKDGIEGSGQMLSDEQMSQTMQQFQSDMMNKVADADKPAADQNQKEGEMFLAENGKRPGVVTTASGLQYEVITEGTGDRPTAESYVTVHYRGTLIDGKEFDSSYKRGEPTSFPLSGVIAGWTEGLQLMKVGSKYKFFIPPNLAYGPRGAGSDIGPNATLIFEVELIGLQK